MTEISTNELEARRIEVEIQTASQERRDRIQIEAQEQQLRMQLESQEKTFKMQTEFDVKKVSIPVRHATFRWITTMSAYSLVAIGCAWLIAKYPLVWHEILPVGGFAEVLILLTTLLKTKELSK